MDVVLIRRFISDLDAAVPREDARVLLTVYGGGPDESKMVGTERGYLRLGIEIMKAGLAPESPDANDPAGLSPDIDSIVHPDSTVNFDWFERRDPGVPIASESDSSGRVFAVAIVTALGAVAALAVVGAVALVRAFVN